jgi:DNA-binding NarL/FixJ family response regulator
MPGTDGVEATRQIVRRHSKTRIVILTATPHGCLATQALEAGAHALLAKSGRYNTLVDVISDHLSMGASSTQAMGGGLEPTTHRYKAAPRCRLQFSPVTFVCGADHARCPGHSSRRSFVS